MAESRDDRRKPPLSYNAALVLQAIAQGYRYGFDIMRATELPSGTVYPLLRRLEGSSLVRSGWETRSVADAEGRPRRRYYEATAAGEAALVEALGRLRAQRRLFEAGGGEDSELPVTG